MLYRREKGGVNVLSGEMIRLSGRTIQETSVTLAMANNLMGTCEIKNYDEVFWRYRKKENLWISLRYFWIRHFGLAL